EFGHVQHKAKGPAAGGCDRLNGLGRRVAIYVEHSDLRSLPRIPQGDRPACTRPTSGDHCNAFLKKPGHFIVPIAQRIANYQKMIRLASEALHESERSRSAARCQLRTHAVQQTETLSITSSARASKVGEKAGQESWLERRLKSNSPLSD